MIERPFLRGASLVVLAMILSLLPACESTGPGPGLEKEYGRPLPEGAIGLERVHDLTTLPNLRALFARKADVLASLEQSALFFQKPSSKRWFPHRVSDREISHENLVRTIALLREALVNSADEVEFEGHLLRDFDFYRSVGWDGSGEVLYTAYVTPLFDGRRTKDAIYRYPLYRLPEDLVKAEDGTPLGRRGQGGELLSNPTRAEIEEGELYKGTELVWLDDPFKVYIVHVQGSARIRLRDGTETVIGYAGKTEHPYVSIRQALVNEGKIDRNTASLQSIEDYFAANPADLERVLALNPSYVFFTEYGEGGPYGSIGSLVTSGHTIATDKSVFPRGSPAITAVRLPRPQSGSDRSVAWDRDPRLVFDQDTGGAIRSAGRCDLYLGVGEEAKRMAGMVKDEGELFYFFAKP